MPSIIEGYNYDIFISYRQKDNKGDMWVSEFVEALKTELESTFKEEISVYFDINPHDGLLETHDVDESLKEKLKCLVFIPIISRTYCDPKAFAWQHEFKAFVEQASKDQYGLKVKLPNGNVASRILPVQIHDLDSEDINLCESVLGSVLRGIEFIYKSSGVNRPLLPKEEEPQDNQNHTNYRDQINKVANAIKDIITAIQNYSPQKVSQAVLESESVPVPQKSEKTPIIITSVVALAMISLGILFIPKLFKPSEELEKSIAVLPFKNDSPDQERMYFINGTMEAILDNLCKIKDLRVPGRTSVEQYRDNLKPIPTIAKELDVNYILEGSGHRDGNNVRLFVQLLDARKDKHLWSNTYDSNIEDIFSMQSEIAQSVARELKAAITPEEKQTIEKIPTTNLEAYDLILQANNNAYYAIVTGDIEPIIELSLKAIELDPYYADAYAFAGTITLLSGVWLGTKSISAAIVDSYDYYLKSLELDPDNSPAHFGMGLINEWGKWNYVEAEKEFLRALEGAAFTSLDENWGYSVISEFYFRMNQPEEALKYEKMRSDIGDVTPYSIIIKCLYGQKEEAQILLDKISSKMVKEGSFLSLGDYYDWMVKYDSAKYCYESAINVNDPLMSVPRSKANLALSYYKTNNYSKAQVIVSQLKILSMEAGAGSPDFFLGVYYSGIGENDSAFYWLEKAYNSRSPEFHTLKINPKFNSLKNDRRYWDLYERTGHKAYDEYLASKKNN